ncbi:MAG: hypothetical protein AABX07_06305 [Nanoarchaeota archaeon]
MDYGMPERRKSKNDKKAKARFNKYKKGGKYRVQNSVANKN